MMITQCIFLLITARVFINVRGDECNLVENKSPNLQLFRHLFCEYEASERPTTDPRNATVLRIILIPKLIKFEDYGGKFLVHTWLYITWKDEYLQWKASDFNGIDSIWVQSKRIWTPVLAIQNAVSADSSQFSIPMTNCILSNTGNIVCVPSALFSTRCNADYSYWPFDRHNCSIEISSWSYRSNEILFKDDKFHIVMSHYEQNAEWNVISVDTTHIHKKSSYVSYDEFPVIVAYFIMQRAESQLWHVFGTPTLILTAITLTTLWLDPKSNERWILGCVNFLCHFLYVGNLHWIVPSSETIPNILLFYHNSIILTIIALILTCIFRKIVDAKDSPPPCISSCVTMILTSKIGQILLLSILDPKASARVEEDAEDNSNLVNRHLRKKSTWAYVTIILSWISFISFLLIYITMFALFLRMPDTLK